MPTAPTNRRAPWRVILIAIATAPLLIVWALVYLIALAAAASFLLLTTWAIALLNGPYVVIVYSDSPHWQAYFEEQILPAAANRASVLNWSERRRWRLSLPVAMFRVFGGSRNFNPLALIVRPGRLPRALRFFQPFQALKHGRPEEVEHLRRELLAALASPTSNQD